jgi:short subunit fatty acids transporter
VKICGFDGKTAVAMLVWNGPSFVAVERGLKRLICFSATIFKIFNLIKWIYLKILFIFIIPYFFQQNTEMKKCSNLLIEKSFLECNS